MDGAPEPLVPGSPRRLAREQFEARLEQLRRAAAEWQISPATPDYAVVSALIGALAELGSLNVTAVDELRDVMAEGREVATVHVAESQSRVMELERSIVSAQLEIERSRMVVGQTTRERELLVQQAIAKMSDRVAEELKRPLTTTVYEWNRMKRLENLARVAVITLVIAFLGFCLGSWSASGASDIERAVRACEQKPLWSGQDAVCDLRGLDPWWRSSSGG